MKYRWNGEVVEIRHVMLTIKESKQNPHAWYNYHCYLSEDPNGHAFIPGIEISLKEGGNFIISNHAGTGINKLKKGGFWDQYSGHFRDEDILLIEYNIPKWMQINSLDEQEYVELEIGYKNWKNGLDKN